MQRLEGALESLRRAFAGAKGVAKLAEEAAAKCQVRRSVGSEAGVGIEGRPLIEGGEVAVVTSLSPTTILLQRLLLFRQCAHVCVCV